ncbi:hypothetical protein KSP39_PZI015167 [Platanthera zijinensis]|uniref:Uncharacterized protein n=1 Tax=Platanthera zijinensis TaxID=2320716 RepID=A0AAP0B9U6_9ASPA
MEGSGVHRHGGASAAGDVRLMPTTGPRRGIPPEGPTGVNNQIRNAVGSQRAVPHARGTPTLINPSHIFESENG